MAHVSALPQLARTEAEPLLATIGNTPLLRLEKIPREFPDIEIFAKAEYFNPGGSVKDRAALNMILDGERSGKLNHSRVILDSTSGNTGIAYAMIGANRGYKVKLCLPANASQERKRILKAYGAEMVFSDPGEGSDGAIRLCREIYMADPDRYFYPDQYNNPANWKAHFETTGPEIIEQTGGRITHFVDVAWAPAAPSSASRRRLKRDLPDVKCYLRAAFQRLSRPGRPEAHAHRDRARHLRRDAGRRQPLDRNRRRLPHGAAAGARGRAAGGDFVGRNVHAATMLARAAARERGESGIIVTMLCDSADKYLSEHFWDEE